MVATLELVTYHGFLGVGVGDSICQGKEEIGILIGTVEDWDMNLIDVLIY